MLELTDFMYGRVDGKHTFNSVLVEFWDDVSRTWKAESTIRGCRGELVLWVLPEVDSYKTIESYTLDDFENLIDVITEKYCTKNGHINQGKIRKKIKRYVKLVSLAAEKNHVTKSPFPCKEQVRESKKKDYVGKRRKPRVFRKNQLKELVSIFCGIEWEDGYLYGLLLMFTAGLRNEEAASITFGDLICEYDHFLFVQTTVYKDKDGKIKRRHRMKTQNGTRYAYIFDFGLELILRRKQIIMQMIIEKGLTDELSLKFFNQKGHSVEEIVNECGVASKYDFDSIEDFETIPSSENLTNRGRQLFGEMKTFTQKEFEKAKDYALYDFLECDSPSAYLFRRNYLTMLDDLGIEEDGIVYLAGHVMDSIEMRREYINNEDKRNEICRRCKKHPLLSNKNEVQKIMAQENKILTFADAQGTYEIVGDITPDEDFDYMIVLEFTTNEPGDRIDLIYDGTSEGIQTDMKQLSEKNRNPVDLSNHYAKYMADDEKLPGQDD